MKTITRETLKTKLDRKEQVSLILAMGPGAYDLAHIPGSQRFENLSEAVGKLSPSDEVVVYSSTAYCHASFTAYAILRRLGFKNVYRYAGGLEDWQKAGYPLEGRMALSLRN